MVRGEEGEFIQGFEGACVGHGIRVQLVHTVVDRGYIDFKFWPISHVSVRQRWTISGLAPFRQDPKRIPLPVHTFPR
jgi:hypothetical protein